MTEIVCGSSSLAERLTDPEQPGVTVLSQISLAPRLATLGGISGRFNVRAVLREEVFPTFRSLADKEVPSTVLGALTRHPALTSDEIAGMCGLDPDETSKRLRTLVATGLIEQVQIDPGEDGFRLGSIS